jgi:hypothetical protein
LVFDKPVYRHPHQGIPQYGAETSHMGLEHAISQVVSGQYIAIHHSDDVWEAGQTRKAGCLSGCELGHWRWYLPTPLRSAKTVHRCSMKGISISRSLIRSTERGMSGCDFSSAARMRFAIQAF